MTKNISNKVNKDFKMNREYYENKHPQIQCDY